MNTKKRLDSFSHSVSIIDNDSYSTVCCPEYKFSFVGGLLCDQLGYPEHALLGKALREFDSPVQHLCDQYRKIHDGCFHPTPQKCKILKPSFLQT